jgi:hypothetical protein
MQLVPQQADQVLRACRCTGATKDSEAAFHSGSTKVSWHSVAAIAGDSPAS